VTIAQPTLSRRKEKEEKSPAVFPSQEKGGKNPPNQKRDLNNPHNIGEGSDE